jgi:hypothetical protein
MDNFQDELKLLVNKFGIDNSIGVPDRILAAYLTRTLFNFSIALNELDKYPLDVDDPSQMDGDHQSALQSAGMGTDEDYGAGERL